MVADRSSEAFPFSLRFSEILFAEIDVHVASLGRGACARCSTTLIEEFQSSVDLSILVTPKVNSHDSNFRRKCGETTEGAVPVYQSLYFPRKTAMERAICRFELQVRLELSPKGSVNVADHMKETLCPVLRSANVSNLCQIWVNETCANYGPRFSMPHRHHNCANV
jgi:hypothetical protein